MKEVYGLLSVFSLDEVKLLKIISGVAGLVIVLYLLLGLTLGGGFSGMRACPLADCEKPLQFVHRGISGFPENSMRAFQAAFSRGFNAVELDVRQSKDGVVLVFHDADGKRLLGIDSAINEMRWSSLKNKCISGSQSDKILLLDMVLSTLPSKGYLYLDIKEPSAALADSVISMVNKHSASAKVLVASEDFGFLMRIRRKAPEIMTVMETFNAGREWLYYLIPVKFKPDFYSGASTYVTEKHVAFLKENKLLNRRIVFDVQKENIRKYQSMGLKHFIVDVDSGTNAEVFRYSR